MEVTTPSPYERTLADDALLAYIEWREECAVVRECHRRWGRTTREDAVRAHAAYQAALDREEAAARVYRKRLERVADLLQRRDKGPCAHGTPERSSRLSTDPRSSGVQP